MARARAQVIRSEAADIRAEMATRDVPEKLRPYVRGWAGYRERTGVVTRRREFPGPAIVVIIEFGPPIRVASPNDATMRQYRGGFVAGLDDSWTFTEHDGLQQGLQINFTPIGARLFFQRPIAELTRQVVSFDDLLPNTHLAEALAELSDWDARFDLVERLISSRMHEARIGVDPVEWAFKRIDSAGGAIELRDLCDELGYSAKHTIALFHKQLGMPPKLLARLVRFDRLMTSVKNGGAKSWSDLAPELGFADQSHLIREVRAFTGLTPKDAVAFLADFFEV